MVIDLISGILDITIFVLMFFLIVKTNGRIKKLTEQNGDLEKKIQKLTKDQKKYHEELMDSFDDKSIDDKSITIAEGVTDIIETLEEFEVPYNDVGRVIDEKNLPNYKITFSEGFEILLCYDFQTVTLITPDDSDKFTDWTEFKNTLINVLSLIKCPENEGEAEEPGDNTEEN